MKVAESEVMCVEDDDGVGVWDVKSVFDDGGREQDIGIAIYKVKDDVFQLVWGHLSVRYADAGLRHKGPDAFFYVVESGDAVVYDEHLSVAPEFEVDGVGEERVVVGVHFGADGIAVGRGRLDDGEVACAHERELEGAGYGGGGEGKGIDGGFHLPDAFFDGDAELLFLVDDEKPEVMEADALADEFVGPDDDVDFTGGEVVQDGFCLLGIAGSREIVHAYGHVFETFGESSEVLVSEYGGGYEKGGLFVVGSGFEGGADSNFCFSEAYVAADEAVHGVGAFHVGFDGLCGFELVWGVVVEEGGFEFVLHEAVGTESKAFGALSGGVEADEVAGNVFYFVFCALFEVFPRAGAKFIKAGRFAFAPFVFAHLVKGVDGDEDVGVVEVGDFDGFLCFAVVEGNTDESAEASDAVVDVDDEVADVEFAKLFEGEGKLAVAGVVGAEDDFVDAVEDLVVGEKAGFEGVVGETGMEGSVDGREFDVGGLAAKDVGKAVGLLDGVG